MMFTAVFQGMSRFSKKALEFVELFLTGKGELADASVKNGILDYSGQGKDEYGR